MRLHLLSALREKEPRQKGDRNRGLPNGLLTFLRGRYHVTAIAYLSRHAGKQEKVLNITRWTVMNWHTEKSNASVISLRIWYQQHFSVLSKFIERCTLASSLLIGKTFHLYAAFLIGFLKPRAVLSTSVSDTLATSTGVLNKDSQERSSQDWQPESLTTLCWLSASRFPLHP